jgi:serine/threonine-protein kinase
VSDTEPCPDEVDLHSLADGTLGRQRAAVIRDHIGDCDTCRRTVAEVVRTMPRTSARLSDAPGPDETTHRYELRRLLATGGMGEVFLARDTLLERDVAIKLLHEEEQSPESLAQSRRRLLREAQALARLAHPNVVSVFDHGLMDGRPFLAMEYVEGRTLREWIADDHPPLDKVLEVLLQVGRGLVAAHELGLVHRDVKPDNVLVGSDGRARVTDFGLARAIDPSSSASVDGTSRAGPGDSEIAGTPAYMPPEQFSGGTPDARWDQYAFAVMAHEAVFGVRPSALTDRSQPRATARTDGAPLVHVDRVLQRGLAPDPDARFPSLRALLDALASPHVPKRRARTWHIALGTTGLLVGITVVGWALARRAPVSSSPPGLHSSCGGAAGGCIAPLVCKYPSGNYCGASGALGVCAWPADDCGTKSTEVCGCDGVTYRTRCEAHRAGAASAYGGGCVACSADEICPDVSETGSRTPAFCHVASGEVRDQRAPMGTCWPRPSACPKGDALVCAWDGQTYESACEARRAGFDVAHAGACKEVQREPARVGAGVTLRTSDSLAFGAPEEVGMNARPLVRLAHWVESERLPLLSLLISRNGVVVFELYTFGVEREDAHYTMGATAALTSALVGVLVDRHLIGGPEASVADVLPEALFPDADARRRFRGVTVRNVLDMSALDAPVPPEEHTPEAVERGRRFVASTDRVRFALGQPLLDAPGTSFRISEITPEIAIGMIRGASKTTALEFAETSLFGPMDFKNYEWMYRDAAGNDMGGYGLRLRPIDMQKLGILYLREGAWGGRRLLSSDWVRRSFIPTVKRNRDHRAPDYGAYWTSLDFGVLPSRGGTQAGRAWVGHAALGWKGQRIAVFPEAGVVVTMTGVIEPPDDETAIFARVIRDFVMPAVDAAPVGDALPSAALRDSLDRVRAAAPSPVKEPREARLVPGVLPKEPPHQAPSK